VDHDRLVFTGLQDLVFVAKVDAGEIAIRCSGVSVAANRSHGMAGVGKGPGNVAANEAGGSRDQDVAGWNIQPRDGLI
jgi:hypothetical protein